MSSKTKISDNVYALVQYINDSTVDVIKCENIAIT